MKRICVRGLVVTEKGLSVMFRRKIKDGKVSEYYVVPGGGVEGEEDLESALVRELDEELNIKVNIKELAFKVETEERIEYFYNCEFVSGTFELKGEEKDRNTEENYYEPKFILVDEISKFNIQDEVKEYFNK